LVPRSFDLANFTLTFDKAQKGYSIRFFHEWREYGTPDFLLRR
jgi:hypothetical protein